MTTPLTLSDILTTISQMEYVSEEKIQQFAEQLRQAGLNEETMAIFSELVAEEVHGRDEEIQDAEAYLEEIQKKLAENEPWAQEQERELDQKVDEMFTEIEREAEHTFATITHDVFEAIHADQAVQDEEKIANIKKSAGI